MASLRKSGHATWQITREGKWKEYFHLLMLICGHSLHP